MCSVPSGRLYQRGNGRHSMLALRDRILQRAGVCYSLCPVRNGHHKPGKRNDMWSVPARHLRQPVRRSVGVRAMRQGLCFQSDGHHVLLGVRGRHVQRWDWDLGLRNVPRWQRDQQCGTRGHNVHGVSCRILHCCR